MSTTPDNPRFKALIFIGLITFFTTPATAQQLLNFDFEELSIEGMVRPWSWDFVTYSETAIALDSVVKHHGNYSLRMWAEKTSEKLVMSHFLEPYELSNNVVTIEGWIKTKGIEGNVRFVLLAIAGEDAETEWTSEAISNDQDWKKLMIKGQLPDSISTVSLSLEQEGIGTVWFDDFKLFINDTLKQSLELMPAFTKSQVQWIANQSIPIKAANPLQIEDEDLGAFKALARDANIIALGESTHGTREFFELKHRMLKYCVQELGVRVFAIEDNQLIVNRVNHFVLGGTGTARSSMNGMFSVWQTREVHDLIAWIRQYNDLHPDDKVEFVGFDVQNHSLPVDSLYAFINQQAPELSASIQGLLDDLRANGAMSYSVSDSVKLEWYTHAQEVLALVSGKAEQWLLNAKTRTDSLPILLGVQYANLVKQFAENTYKGHESLYRDIAMAENVSWIHNVYKPGSKILIWAHDVHISRGEHPNAEANIYSGKSMGAHLAKQYGEQFKSFGLSTYKGEYAGFVSYTNFQLADCPLYPAPRGTLDHALHTVATELKSPMLFFDLSNARKLDWLTQPRPVRFANHVNIEYGYWTRYSVPYQFDGLFFIDETTSARSYAR